MACRDINLPYMKRLAEIRTLRAFVTVAREGNTSRAAAILNLTQPAVSLQLKRLSEDTGLTLFRRTPRGLELTPDGAAMLVKAERVLSALTEFSQTASRIGGRIQGRLRIGTIVDPEFIRLGQLLAGLVAAYPDLRTELVHGMSGDVITNLLRGRIDAGFFLGELDGFDQSGEAGHAGAAELIFQKTLSEITYRVVAPPGWEPLVTGKDWASLAGLPWICTPPESVHSRLLRRIFGREGSEQKCIALVDQEPAMLAMVASGVGLSLCQESIAIGQKQSRGIVIADKVKIDTTLSFVTLRNQLQDPNVESVLGILNDIWTI